MPNELLQKALEAHGGLDQWSRVATVRATDYHWGANIRDEGHAPGFNPSPHGGGNKARMASVTPYGADDQRTDFTADRIAIEKMDGAVVKERLHPSEHFTLRENIPTI